MLLYSKTRMRTHIHTHTHAQTHTQAQYTQHIGQNSRELILLSEKQPIFKGHTLQDPMYVTFEK